MRGHFLAHTFTLPRDEGQFDEKSSGFRFFYGRFYKRTAVRIKYPMQTASGRCLMVNVLIRLIRVLPVLAVVAGVTALLYGLLVATSTRDKARRILIKVLSVVNGALAVAFTLVMLYALFENNTYVLEVADVSAALFAIIFIIVRIIAWHMRAKTSSKETK